MDGGDPALDETGVPVLAEGTRKPSDPALGATGVAFGDGTMRASDQVIPPAAPGTGRTVAGRFETRGELGRGAFGSVHRAFDTVSRDEVAIKIIADVGTELADRVRREVRAARRVTHPNVVRVYDIVEDGTALVLSMELVKGESLEHWLVSTSRPDATVLLRMAREMTDGVAAAHAAGVIHRDLKPANVMVRHGSGACLVTDFGVARPIEDAGAMDATREGALVGTPLYMAPEQLVGSTEVGPPADVYALGLVIYELVTGTRPHSAQSLVGLANLRAEGALPDMAAVPATLHPILVRCLAPTPAERYADAGELARALDGLHGAPLASPKPVAEPPAQLATQPPRRPHRGRIVIVTVVALAAIGVAAALVLRSGRPSQGLRPPLRVYLRTVPDGPDEAAWLARTSSALVRYLVEAQAVTFSFVDKNDPHDLVVAVDAKQTESGISVDVRTGTTEQNLAVLTHRDGPNLEDVLEQPAIDLVTFLGKGRSEREPTQPERAAMDALGARSLAGYLFYQRGLESNERTQFELAETLDPSWPHLQAALLYADALNGRPMKPAATPPDPERDRFGHELIALLSKPDELDDPERVEARVPASKCAAQDTLCRLVRLRYARLSDEQMLGEAQHLCGPRFSISSACAQVEGVLARSGNAEAADRFIAAWRLADPGATDPIVFGALAAIRAGDVASAATGVHRLALINDGTLSAQTALSIAIGDYVAAATSATKLMGREATKDGGRYQLATVYILQGHFRAAIGLLRELTADDVVLMREYSFEALISLYTGLGDRDEAARTLDRWFASPSPPTGLKAVVRHFERDLLGGKRPCPSVDAVLATLDVSVRDLVGQTLRRLAADHGCGTCAPVLADGSGGLHRASSNVAFGRCALAQGELELAEKMFAKESRVLLGELDPGALPSPFASVIARLHLAETHLAQHKTELAKQELDAFLTGWKNADRPLAAIERARQLRARL